MPDSIAHNYKVLLIDMSAYMPTISLTVAKQLD